MKPMSFVSFLVLSAALITPSQAAAPGPVGDTVQLSHNPNTGETTITWGPVAEAVWYNTYVGTIPESAMGGQGISGYQVLSASGGGGQFIACPGNKRVIGGGAEGSSPIVSSRPEPPGTGWYASAGGPFVVAYAICADVDPSYEIVSASGGGNQFAPCPGSKRVLGGGAESTSLLYLSRPESPGIGWTASAGGPFVVSYAICADPLSSYQHSLPAAAGASSSDAPAPRERSEAEPMARLICGRAGPSRRASAGTQAPEAPSSSLA